MNDAYITTNEMMKEQIDQNALLTIKYLVELLKNSCVALKKDRKALREKGFCEGRCEIDGESFVSTSD